MDYKQIIGDLKKKQFKPVYFLMGDEPYFIDRISDYIEEHALSESEKEFNQTVLYGRDVDAAAVVNAAKRYPMMSPRQVVIVKEAQQIDDIGVLEHYMVQPQPTTILVICYKYKILDKRKKLYKLLKDRAVLFTSDKIRDYKMADWILAYCSEIGVGIKNKSAQMLAEFLGTDLSKVVNEIDKLKLVMPKNSNEITPALIEEYIGISKDYNAFELLDALAKRDILKANRIVKYFAANPKQHPIQMVVVPIFNFFSNLMIYHYLPDKSDYVAAPKLGVPPFVVKQYGQAARIYNAWKVMENVSVIREFDAKSKGFGNVSSDSGELLKELIYKLTH